MSTGHSTIGRRLAAIALGLTAVTTVAGCAIGFRGPAPDVSDSTAFIQGDVLSNRTEQGEAWFKWGATTAYGNETPHGTVAFEAGARQGYFGFLSGLDHNTTYHFALCADDQEPGVGAFCSGDQTFTTGGDHVRGEVTVLFNDDFIDVNFDDVESGYHGESPRGTVSVGTSAPMTVTCLSITGPNRFTVGVDSLSTGVLFFIDVPNGAGTAASQSLAAPPASCPADPPAGTQTFPAGVLSGLDVHDEG